MSNNSAGDRPRRKGPRSGPSDKQPRQARQGGGDRPRGERRGGGQGGQGGPRGGGRQNAQRSGRLSREELEWARDLWQHNEPADEIAHQIGVPVEEIEALIAGWAGRAD
jgi:hypothetical protein